MLQKAILCKASYDDADPRFTTVGDLRFGLINNTLVFRGTANGKNALRDVTVIPGRTRRGYLAHKGFIQAEAALWDAVMARIYAEAPRDLQVTGHSLGGAIALLFAEAFNLPAVTFGCPRVYFRFGTMPGYVKHTRVICDDDPVPMVPRVFYTHNTAARVLRDRDGGIDVKDHGIDVYIRRLTKCAG